MNKHDQKIATVRASVLWPLIAFLDAQTRETDVLLSEHGLLRAHLQDPYAQVTLKRYVGFFETSANFIGDSELGLRLGAAVRPTDLGPLGVLFSDAPTLREAFALISESICALQSATTLGMKRLRELTVWTYKIDDPDIWPRRQDAVYSLAATCRLARASAGVHFNPVEVHFEHAAARNTGALERYFQAPVRFEQDANRLLLDNRVIDRQHRSGDQDLARILKHHVEDLLAEHTSETTIVQRVKRLIGLNIGVQAVTISRLADELGMSSRTLQRKLETEGSSLRELLRDHRKAAAEMAILSKGLTNSDIAHRLGYKDATVFWRAFRNWTGQTPSTFKKTS